MKTVDFLSKRPIIQISNLTRKGRSHAEIMRSRSISRSHFENQSKIKSSKINSKMNKSYVFGIFKKYAAKQKIKNFAENFGEKL